MEKLLMNSGLISAIVLAFVGIVKLPFGTLKEKHPKVFKAFITFITLISIVSAVVAAQTWVFEQVIISFTTLELLIAVLAGVFVTYNGIYEGFGVKKLFALFVAKLKELADKKSDSKLTKLINKVGLEKVDEIINALTAKTEAEAQMATEKTEN